MRPNVDIPWSIHGKIKEYAQANNITIEEAYVDSLKAGTDELAVPNISDQLTLSKDDEWLPFGPRVIRSQGKEPYEINNVTTCHPYFSTSDQPVRVVTRRQNVSADELKSKLASLQKGTRIEDDWFTIHQIGGSWVGRGLTNFSHAISTAKNLFTQASFPLYKQGIVVYIAELPNENEYLILRAELSRRRGKISKLTLTFLLDGYPINGREYYKIASHLGFSWLSNAREHHLPSLHAYFKNQPEVNVAEVVTRDTGDQGEPLVSGLIIENPFQENADWKSELEWRDIPDERHQEDAKFSMKTLTNYDHLYCELRNHHSVGQDKGYRLEGISATYLSTLLGHNSVWNIAPSVDW